MFREFILTGAVFGTVGDAVGFSSLALIQRQHASSSAEYQLEVLQAISDDSDAADFKKGVSNGQKFMRHYLSITPTLKQRILFKGILGDGLQLQLQITVFAMFKFLIPGGMTGLQLWISIVGSFCKIPVAMLEVFAVIKFNRLASTVSAKLNTMSVACQKKVAKDQVQDALNDIAEMRRQSTMTLLEFYLYTLLLVLMYVWAFAKLWMSHVCQDNMWNINIDPAAGCVDLPESLKSKGVF